MENIPNTSAPSFKHRWLWAVLAVLVLLLIGLGGYLAATGLPTLYSPTDVVRKSEGYLQKLNPPRLTSINTNVSPVGFPSITMTTNLGKVRIEYPAAQGKAVNVMGFTLHMATNGETIQLGDTTINLKRIGQGWVPPGTNVNHYQSAVPARFYSPDLVPLMDADVLRDLPNQWERNVDCQNNMNGYRFDFAIQGTQWKVLDVSFYDARTHSSLINGSVSQHTKQGYKFEAEPFIWHFAPVELVMDLALGPVEEEEILPQTGATFTVGSARYYLIYTSDNSSGGYHGSGNDGKKSYLELLAPSAQPARKKECVLLFLGSPKPDQRTFDLEFLNAEGKPCETGGGSHSAESILQFIRGDLADIKKIRVRKFSVGHRLVFHLPGLPGLPSGNQSVDNLFKVRAPMLRFDREYEQIEYVRRITQLGLGNFPYTNVPAGTYPRWFTNATPVEVLEDYGKLMGAQGDIYIDQEKLEIEVRKRSWPLEALGKVRDFWKKIKGP